MTAVMVLQARMTSTRLPGKVLRVVKGRSLLEWVIRAGRQVKDIDTICVAIAMGEVNEPIVNEAKRLNAVVVRGSEDDVLDRFRLAAEVTSAHQIIRVTTDCPLTDSFICGEVLKLLKNSGADYACNNEPYSFPHGLDCEAFTRDVLERAAATATKASDREHVTPWIKHHPSVNKSYLHGPGGKVAQWRWTVDTPEDLLFFETISQHLGTNSPNWEEIVEILELHPEYHEINRKSRQR